MQRKKPVTKARSLPSLRHQLGHKAGVVEVTFYRETGLTITPLGGAVHDGRQALQERGGKWIRRLLAVLEPVQLVRLKATVPATPSLDGSLSAEGTREIANWLKFQVSQFKDSWYPNEGPKAVTVMIEAKVGPEADVNSANIADIYVTAQLKTLDIARPAAEVGAYEIARSDLAQEIAAPFVVLWMGSASWLIGSGVQSLVVEVSPEQPVSREFNRKPKVSRKAVAQMAQ